jgi:RimJ/RimL family protein N-acetyltransferase
VEGADMLRGKTTFLSAIERADLPFFKAWRNNPDFRKNFREYRELCDDNQSTWYEKSVLNDKNTLMFSIHNSKTNELIGCCGLCYINWVQRFSDLSFYIGKDNLYVDEIYAPDAVDCLLNYGFEEIGLHKIWTEIYEFDEKKIRLLEEIGFKRDGLLRDNYFHDGRWWNSIIFSLLQNEYTAGDGPAVHS